MKKSKRNTHGGADSVSVSQSTAVRIERALASLKTSGVRIKARRVTLTVRLNTGILKAAKERSRIYDNDVLVNAALAVLAADDDFGRVLLSLAGTLSDDFETAI